jgi:hypothetical protein
VRKENWPVPGDTIMPYHGLNQPCVAWRGPRTASGVETIERKERLLVIARALNPDGDWREEGVMRDSGERWSNTWWMALRPNGRWVWINEAQMESFYRKADE